jgi:hypothetical protein
MLLCRLRRLSQARWILGRNGDKFKSSEPGAGCQVAIRTYKGATQQQLNRIAEAGNKIN